MGLASLRDPPLYFQEASASMVLRIDLSEEYSLAERSCEKIDVLSRRDLPEANMKQVITTTKKNIKRTEETLTSSQRKLASSSNSASSSSSS